MNKYFILVLVGAVAGVVIVYTSLSLLRSESIAGKDCNANYSGCVDEYTCAGIGESVKVTGTDVYGLDRDGDGTGCDWNGGTWESKTTFRSILFGGVGGIIITWLSVKNRYLKEVAENKEREARERSRSRREHAMRVGMICPKCGNVLTSRSGKYGKFIGCSGFPSCTYTKKPHTETRK